MGKIRYKSKPLDGELYSLLYPVGKKDLQQDDQVHHQEDAVDPGD